MSDLVENPEDQFSLVTADIVFKFLYLTQVSGVLPPPPAPGHSDGTHRSSSVWAACQNN